jgi:hypothetical protein
MSLRFSALLFPFLLVVACASENADDLTAAAPGGTGGSNAGGSNAGGSSAGGSSTGGSNAGGSGTTGGGMPCAVQELLVNRCQQCHSDPPQFGAPMPLVTREHLLAAAPSDGSTSAGARSVVRMKDGAKPMPQPPNPPATAAEIAALEAWVSGGMPAVEETCGGGGSGGDGGSGGSSGGSGGSGGSGQTVACTPDVVVKAAKPWTIKKSDADRYVCFGGKIPATGKKRHITQVSVNIDNTAHAHHLCIYDMGTKAVPTNPEVCDAGGGATKGGKLLHCWAPGADANVLPPEAGFPVDATKDTNILIEMHYSNIQGAPDSTDNSAATFCTTDQLRQYDADVMAFGSSSFSLPPAQSTTVEATITAQSAFLSQGWIRVIRGWPHMHLLGVAQSTEVLRGGQKVGDLGSTSTYSFHNQISYPVDVTIKSGDTIVTKCVYNNTTTSVVSFGEETEAEMCYNFVTYYPRITTPGWVWPAPTYLGKTKTYPTP